MSLKVVVVNAVFFAHDGEAEHQAKAGVYLQNFNRGKVVGQLSIVCLVR